MFPSLTASLTLGATLLSRQLAPSTKLRCSLGVAPRMMRSVVIAIQVVAADSDAFSNMRNWAALIKRPIDCRAARCDRLLMRFNRTVYAKQRDYVFTAGDIAYLPPAITILTAATGHPSTSSRYQQVPAVSDAGSHQM